MAFEADDVEAACALARRREWDVRAAPGHVRGDGDGAGLAGLCDDFGFVGVLLCVEQAERKTAERVGEFLAVGDGACADEDGLIFRTARGDVGGDCAKLGGAIFKNTIGQLDAAALAVEGDDADAEVVGGAQLGGGFGGGAGHSADAVVESEICGARDGGFAGVFLGDLDAGGGFDGLVEAFAPCAVGARASGEFVHRR